MSSIKKTKAKKNSKNAEGIPLINSSFNQKQKNTLFKTVFSPLKPLSKLFVEKLSVFFQKRMCKIDDVCSLNIIISVS